jgi:hypothetical protein
MYWGKAGGSAGGKEKGRKREEGFVRKFKILIFKFKN